MADLASALSRELQPAVTASDHFRSDLTGSTTSAFDLIGVGGLFASAIPEV